MIMLVIVLGAIGVPEAGLALIFAVDRPLDMVRTITNVTGDATVSIMVAKSLDKLGEPEIYLKSLVAEVKIKEATRSFNPRTVYQALKLNLKN